MRAGRARGCGLGRALVFRARCVGSSCRQKTTESKETREWLVVVFFVVFVFVFVVVVVEVARLGMPLFNDGPLPICRLHTYCRS